MEFGTAHPFQPGAQRQVKCFTCGRTEAVSSDDLLGYLQTGWPRCCGEVMTYFTDADGADGETGRDEG